MRHLVPTKTYRSDTKHGMRGAEVEVVQHKVEPITTRTERKGERSLSTVPHPDSSLDHLAHLEKAALERHTRALQAFDKVMKAFRLGNATLDDVKAARERAHNTRADLGVVLEF